MSESDDQIPLVRRRGGLVATRLVDLPFARALLQTPGIAQGEDQDRFDEAWRAFEPGWNAAHPTAMAPNEQGIAILDHDTRWIATVGEVGPGLFFGMSVLLSHLQPADLILPSVIGYEGLHRCFEEAWGMGWVGHVCVQSPRGPGSPDVQLPLADFDLNLAPVSKVYQFLMAQHIAPHGPDDDDICIPLSHSPTRNNSPQFDLMISPKSEQDPLSILGFSYEPRGWTLQAAQESLAGWKALAQALIQRGFRFSAADSQAWELEIQAQYLARHPRSAAKLAQVPSPMALQTHHVLQQGIDQGRQKPRSLARL